MIDSDHIQSAIDTEDVIAFSYPSSVDGQPVRRTLSPYVLESDGMILKGWDHGREQVRRYALNKIDSVDVLFDEEFVQPV